MLPCVMGAGDRVPTNLPIAGHSFRRVEVLTGTPRRRRWTDAEKAAIVAETLAPGARTSEVALHHGLHRNQLYEWRRQLRSVADTDAGLVASDFVPVVTERFGCGGARDRDWQRNLAGGGGGRAWLSGQAAAPVEGHR